MTSEALSLPLSLSRFSVGRTLLGPGDPFVCFVRGLLTAVPSAAHLTPPTAPPDTAVAPAAASIAVGSCISFTSGVFGLRQNGNKLFVRLCYTGIIRAIEAELAIRANDANPVAEAIIVGPNGIGKVQLATHNTDRVERDTGAR